MPMEERKERVFLFLQSTLAKYESRRMASNKHYVLSRNLSAEEDFFAPFDRGEQEEFDSMVLDQRTKEGRIVARWLLFVRKKREEVTLEDLADFMQKLAFTFLNSYALATRQYFECVRILIYRSILRLRAIKQLVFGLLATAPMMESNPAPPSSGNEAMHSERRNMQQMATLDRIYQKKVMWMRALNAEHLGIRSEYWMPSEVVMNGNVGGGALGDDENGGSPLAAVPVESTEVVMRAGKDIPFAESINLMGQLEMDYFVVAQYEESVQQNRKNKMAAKVCCFDSRCSLKTNLGENAENA